MTTTMTTITTTGTEAKIRQILGRVACVEGEYSPGADLFKELGVQSLAALELLLSLEEEFGVAIADEAFGRARSLTALVALVEGLR
jgi:acyl carrier protein